MNQRLQSEEAIENPSNYHSNIQTPKGIRKEQKFLESSSEDKEKLIQQNIALKMKLFQLSQELDTLMTSNQPISKHLKNSREDSKVREKRAQLKKEQMEVAGLRTKIQAIKNQMESAYNSKVLLEKEETLKNLKRELEALQQEKASLLKIKDEQKKGLEIAKTEKELQQRIGEKRSQLQIVKQESKSLNQKLLESQRTLRKKHETQITKQSKLKQLSISKQQKKPTSLGITPQMLSQLESEIYQLQQLRKKNQQSYSTQLLGLDKEIEVKQIQQQEKLNFVKQKQKELKLCEIKIKQMEKLQRDKKKIEESRTVVPDLDMQQFRHKRNIKYMPHSDH